MNKKYKILKDDNKVVKGITVYRIEAISEIDNRYLISKGTKGGYIEKEENLSQYDNSWIGEGCIVLGESKISQNALIENDSLIINSIVLDYSIVSESKINDSTIKLNRGNMIQKSIITNSTIEKNTKIFTSEIEDSNISIKEAGAINSSNILNTFIKVPEICYITDCFLIKECELCASKLKIKTTHIKNSIIKGNHFSKIKDSNISDSIIDAHNSDIDIIQSFVRDSKICLGDYKDKNIISKDISDSFIDNIHNVKKAIFFNFGILPNKKNKYKLYRLLKEKNKDIKFEYKNKYFYTSIQNFPKTEEDLIIVEVEVSAKDIQKVNDSKIYCKEYKINRIIEVNDEKLKEYK